MVPFYGCDPVNKVFPPLNLEVPLSKGEGINSVSLIYTCQKKKAKEWFEMFFRRLPKNECSYFWVTHGNIVWNLVL